VDRLAGALGNEVVAVGARLERALIAVVDSRPGVFRIGGFAPGAMLPGDVYMVVLE
jgi:hypothetical protein